MNRASCSRTRLGHDWVTQANAPNDGYLETPVVNELLGGAQRSVLRRSN